MGLLSKSLTAPHLIPPYASVCIWGQDECLQMTSYAVPQYLQYGMHFLYAWGTHIHWPGLTILGLTILLLGL